MKQHFNLAQGAGLALAGALSFAATALSSGQAEASDYWRFDRSPDGAIAQSCNGTGRYTGCATLSCGPDGAIRFTLEDLTPGAPISQKGRITTPGLSDKVKWSRLPSTRRGGADFIASGLNLPVLFDRLKRNSTLGVVINDRISRKRGEIYFSLRGSGRAINRLQQSCARHAARPDRRPGPRPGDLRDPEPPYRPGAPGGPDDGWRAVTPETSPWRYATYREGAVARSCGRFPGRRGGEREICATLFCLRGQGVAFGLDGLAERRNFSPRQGEIRVGRAARRLRFDLLEGPRLGEELYIANHPRVDRLMERLQSGDELEISIEPRDEPLVFTLRNSRRAINRLRSRCDAFAGPSDDGLVINRYRRGVVGHWTINNQGCRDLGWRFGARQIETPDGAICSKVQVAEVASGPLTGGVAIRGSNCRGGDRRSFGDVRIFETLREGRDLVLRTVTSGDEFRIGDRAVFRLKPKSRIIRLRQCRR